MKEAKGKYIARQDDDDVSMKNRLEKQVDFLDKNKAVSYTHLDVYKRQEWNKASAIKQRNDTGISTGHKETHKRETLSLIHI